MGKNGSRTGHKVGDIVAYITYCRVKEVGESFSCAGFVKILQTVEVVHDKE